MFCGLRILCFLLFLTACRNDVSEAPLRPVKAIQVQDAPRAPDQISFPGTLRAFSRADLSFRVDGVIFLRNISVGQKVNKEEVLIRLDPREYELALMKAQGNLESIQAQLDFANRDYERMKNIYERDPGAISASLLDRKKEMASKLKAERDVAQSELENASDHLSYTYLRAPFEGIIAAIYVEAHEQVRAKQTAVRLIDLVDREMEIHVPERYINRLLEGKEQLSFQVYIDAFQNLAFPAWIKEIGTEASSTTQTYPVTLSIEQVPPEIHLLSGMSGRAVLQVPLGDRGSAEQAFEVPHSAILTDDLNRHYVWVIEPISAAVHRQEVSLDSGHKGAGVWITQGIAPGAWIVTAGGSFLSEGQKVKFDPRAP